MSRPWTLCVCFSPRVTRFLSRVHQVIWWVLLIVHVSPCFPHVLLTTGVLFILVSVYIPPQAHVSSALQKLADLITDTEQQHPDSVLIILGDFNKANLSCELPKYRQHITCPTRYSNILYHCYTIIKTAYHSVPLAALGLADHCLVHLIPTYRQKLKSPKPVVKTVKRWTNKTERVLQACLDLTDWSVLRLLQTILTKSWVLTAKLRQLC